MKAPRFMSLADEAMRDPGLTGLRPVIEKELLHYEILNALTQEDLLKNLTFQGGTSLRLLHGAVRYSEDLDFSAGPDFTAAQAGDIAGAVQRHVSESYGVPVRVVEPKEKQHAGTDPVTVSTWSIRVETQPERRNMPAQKIKIDIDTSVSHTSELHSLMVNYDFLPRGYGDLLIRAQTLTEIMANKLVAFPVSAATRNRPRHRDIWDLRWLSQRGARPDLALIKAKAAEHGVSEYADHLEIGIARVDEIVQSAAFKEEMVRFLPSDVREKTIERQDWMTVLARTNRELLSTVLRGLKEPGGTDFEF